jgi:hypothetical protein
LPGSCCKKLKVYSRINDEFIMISLHHSLIEFIDFVFTLFNDLFHFYDLGLKRDRAAYSIIFSMLWIPTNQFNFKFKVFKRNKNSSMQINGVRKINI